MKYKCIFLFFALAINSFLSAAQTGCIIVYGVNNADSRVYTTLAGGTMVCDAQTVTKYSSTNFTTLAPGCSWYPNPAAAPGTARNCIVGSSCGFRTTYTQSCPLDAEVYYPIMGILLIGYINIRKSNFSTLPALKFA